MVTSRADHGGGPAHIASLIKHLGPRVEVHVACPPDRPYWRIFNEAVAGRVIALPHRAFGLVPAARFVRYCKDKGIDLIHAHGKGAGTYARTAATALRLPSVHSPHGIHVGAYGFIRKFLYLAYENLTQSAIDHIIFVSSSEKHFATKLHLWAHTPSSIVPNGVTVIPTDIKDRWRARIRTRLGLKNDRFVVASISRFDYQKNPEETFLIAEKLPQCDLLWIGEGPKYGAIKSAAEERKVSNVNLIGAIDDPIPYLCAADAYLNTSRWEGMPIAILEAMSVGLPVVASRAVGNVDAIIDGSTGYLYTQGDTDEAAARIERLATAPTLRTQLAQASTSRIRSNFSAESTANAIAAIYASLLQQQSLG